MPHFKIRSVDGKEYGPVDLEGMLRWTREGRVTASMPVEVDGSGQWVEARTIPEIASAIASAGVATPPPTSFAPPPPPPSSPADPNAPGPNLLPAAPLQPRTEANLGVSYVFSKAWGLLDGTLILESLVMMAILVVGNFLASGIVSLVLGGPLALGLAISALKKVDGESTKFDDLFSGFNRFGDSFLGNLLTSLIITAGFCACILPGFYLAIRVGLWALSLAAQPKRAGVDSIKDSWSLTSQQFGPLLLLSIVGFFVMLAGILCLGVGAIVSLALLTLVQAVVFRELVPKTAASA